MLFLTQQEIKTLIAMINGTLKQKKVSKRKRVVKHLETLKRKLKNVEHIKINY